MRILIKNGEMLLEEDGALADLILLDLEVSNGVEK